MRRCWQDEQPIDHRYNGTQEEDDMRRKQEVFQQDKMLGDLYDFFETNKVPKVPYQGQKRLPRDAAQSGRRLRKP